MLAIQLVYKPLLVRLTKEWADPSRCKRFDLAFLAHDGRCSRIHGRDGRSYGLDRHTSYELDLRFGFRALSRIGLCHGCCWRRDRGGRLLLYQVITVLRRQATLRSFHFITFGFSVFVPILLINSTGLPGAVIGYLIVMAILLSLLAMEYT